jgi:hypothetical protein
MVERPQVTRRDIEARLITQAWKDEAFVADLRRDPRAAIQRELAKLGIEDAVLPENVEVTVLEETPTHLYLVIPPKPGSDVLSNDELEPWGRYSTA